MTNEILQARFLHVNKFLQSINNLPRTTYPFMHALLNHIGFVIYEGNGDINCSKYYFHSPPFIVVIPPTIFAKNAIRHNGYAVGSFLKLCDVEFVNQIIRHELEISNGHILKNNVHTFKMAHVDIQTVLKFWKPRGKT